MNGTQELQKAVRGTINFPMTEEGVPLENLIFVTYPFGLESTTRNPFPISEVDVIVDTYEPIIPDEIEEVLCQFQTKNWTLENLKETVSFLESNPEVLQSLKEAIIYITQHEKKPFSLKLKLEESPEIEDLKTLFLIITGKYTPKEAFDTLKKIDKEWLIQNVSDVSKFNINIEFL